VAGAEDPLPIAKILLVEGDRPPQIPCRLVGEGELVAGVQGGRVVGAENPLGLLAEFG
jgi:hypothetical protein